MPIIIDALLRQAQLRPDAIAFEDAASSLTFTELAARVGGMAEACRDLPETIGILAPSGLDWVVAALGLTASGRTVIPLPDFFSDAQLGHIIADARLGVIVTTAETAARATKLGCQPFAVPDMSAPLRDSANAPGRHVIYTSGSTGRPKGVVLSEKQISTTCRALLNVIPVQAGDRHLSVLPYSLLLEMICGIYLPIMVGGSVHIASGVLQAAPAEIPVRLAETAARVRPTTCVLVPQLLQGWTMVLTVGRAELPDSLKFLAVGGAQVPSALAERAWALGLPVYEGYGLSECCSVVSVNAPGANRSGTAGRPLPGYKVEIEDGEIVVYGDSVMEGYLNNPPPTQDHVWRTGDLGHMDADGYLTVLGRKDNLIVTPSGRNVSPEWVETMILSDPRISRCVLLGANSHGLVALIEPSLLGAHYLGRLSDDDRNALVEALCSTAPPYATPRKSVHLPAGSLEAAGLLTGNGRPRRAAIAEHFSELLASQYRPQDMPGDFSKGDSK